MKIKLWQKIVFFGSIGALILYVQRDRVKRGYTYIKSKFGDLIESFASEWVGVKEIGNNKAFGNDVFQAMMKNVGWSSSDQWCMYFAKAVHYEVYKDDRENIKNILVGNTQRSFEKVKKDTTGTYKAIESGTPVRGDIAIFQNSNAPDTGHAAVVVKVNSDGTMNTIEGNTSSKSIQDGDTVARKVRPAIIGKKISSSNLQLRGFIRKIEK